MGDSTSYDVVIGLNYGDEGKGLVTDWRVRTHVLEGRNVTVVKHNGGPQAGHTVVHPTHGRFVFSQLGAGSFRGASTHLAGTFLVEPTLLRAEIRAFKTMFGLDATVTIDPGCRIVTPYDAAYNRAVEESRGAGRHGSCGFGINATVSRNLREPFVAACFENLRESDLIEAYAAIGEWYARRAEAQGIQGEYSKHAAGLDAEVVARNAYASMSIITMREFRPRYHTAVVFEGCQGLLLDEYADGFPHVTRSRTGGTNPARMMAGWGESTDFATVYGVTRAYTTRHGEGPLCETDGFSASDPTNVENPNQGKMRFSRSVNVTGQLNTIRHDGFRRVNLVMTCVDQLPNTDYVWTDQHPLGRVRFASFAVGLPVENYYVSRGPTADHVSKVWARDRTVDTPLESMIKW